MDWLRKFLTFITPLSYVEIKAKTKKTPKKRGRPRKK